MQSTHKYLLPFILVTSLFFLWAFLHNINPILIPHLKKACRLSDTQSAFIDTAVYLAYFTIALPAGWFMTMEVDDNFSFEKKAAADMVNDKVRQWETIMWKYQQALPLSKPGEKWVLMHKIFSLNDK